MHRGRSGRADVLDRFTEWIVVKVAVALGGRGVSVPEQCPDNWEMDKKFTRPFSPAAPAACLRQRPLPARSASGSPSMQRRPAKAARSKAWRG